MCTRTDLPHKKAHIWVISAEYNCSYYSKINAHFGVAISDESRFSTNW